MKKIIMLLILSCFVLSGCTYEKEANALYQKASNIAKNDLCTKAIPTYKEIIRRYPKTSKASIAMDDITACEQHMQELFSGYQNIKFGMDKQQVKELFAGKLIQNQREYLKYVKNKAEIIFWFFDNALYEVEVRPNARKRRIGHGPATEDMQNTINALALKYGQYEQVPNMVSVMGFFEQPLEYYRWSFNDKEIILSYWNLGGWFGDIRNNGAAEWETLKIRYRDLGIKQQKEEADSLSELEKNVQAAQQKQQELKGII